MGLQFGVFDHIEPVPGMELEEIYENRLIQIEKLDQTGFYSYHLAEHHTPAVHSLAPSQNVFLGNCSELRGSEQPAAFQEGIETSGPPGAKEGCQGHLAVGALP